MRFKWILVTLSTVVLLPLLTFAVVLVFLSTADLSQYREFIAGQITRFTGRELTLGGEFNIDISSISSVVITDISLANAAWATQPEMLTIERVEASIELKPLLQGRIHVPRFHLTGVKSLVETNSSGSSNWALAEPVEEEADTRPAQQSSAFRLPWIGDMQISKAEIIYHDEVSGKNVTAKLDHLIIGAEEPDSPIVIYVIGQVDNNPLEINGKLLLPETLTGKHVDIPIELHARALGLKLDASGNITGAAKAPSVDLSVEANAANLQKLRHVFGDAVPVAQSVKLVMDVSGEQGQPVSVKLDASAGKARLNSEITVRRGGPRPILDGNIEISDVDVIRLWAPYFKAGSGKAEAKKADAAALKTLQALDQPVPLAWLGHADANLLLSAKEINLPQLHVKKLHSRFIVHDRSFKIVKLDLATGAGSVAADLELDAKGKQAEVQLDFNTTIIELAKLQPLAKHKRFSGSKAEARASVTAKGNSVAHLINSLHGNAQLDYNNTQQKEKLSIDLKRVSGGKADSVSRLDVNADGLIDGHTIKLRGNILPPKSLMILSKPYEIDLALLAFGVSTKVTGTATDPYNLDSFDVDIEASAVNLDGVRRAFGTGIPAVGKTTLTTHLKTRKSKLHLSKLLISFGEARIDGWLGVDLSAAVADIQAELTFSDLDLNTLIPAENKPGKAQEDLSAEEIAVSKIFSDQPLPFERLSRANVKARLSASNLVHKNTHVKEAEVKIDMGQDKLSVELLKFSPVRGELTGNLMVDASNSGAPHISMKLKAPHIELGELLKSVDGTSAVEGPLAADISLQGQGRNAAQIMATLNGSARLLMEQGRADAKALDMLVGGITAVLGTIFTESSSKTKINCAICDLQFNDGVMIPKLAVLDTQYSMVFAEGQVNLKQEQVDLKVLPDAKGVTLSVAVPVIVKGSLSNPDIKVERTGALLKTGEIWATLIYPPAYLVKFTDLGGKQNPCVTMVAEKRGMPIIDGVGKVVKGTAKGVGDTIKDVGSDIGKIFKSIEQDEDSEQSDQANDEDADFDMD
jgi:uncharacterized protein involved in outer membrane biogenesis